MSPNALVVAGVQFGESSYVAALARHGQIDAILAHKRVTDAQHKAHEAQRANAKDAKDLRQARILVLRREVEDVREATKADAMFHEIERHWPGGLWGKCLGRTIVMEDLREMLADGRLVL